MLLHIFNIVYIMHEAIVRENCNSCVCGYEGTGIGGRPPLARNETVPPPFVTAELASALPAGGNKDS